LTTTGVVKILDFGLARIGGAAGFQSAEETTAEVTGPGLILGSLAVLPLENLSGDPEQEYFVEGMHEALITDLAKLSGLKRVIAQPSVMRYKKTAKPLREIARERETYRCRAAWASRTARVHHRDRAVPLSSLKSR
jgi:hypothetical protein